MGKLNKPIEREFINKNLILNKNGTIAWKKSIGKSFSIKYDGILYNFKIVGKDNNKMIISYNGENYSMTASNILKCQIGKIIGYITTDFKYEVGDMINGYKILKQIRKKKKNGKNFRAYEVECIKDGFINIVSETDLDAGKGCPVCSNNVIVKGVNDMWTTDPKLAKLLANADDGYKHSSCSSQLLDWKCPCCGGIIKNKAPSDIRRNYNVHCKYCGDGFSYPEKLMSNILSSLEISFKMHYRIGNQTFMFNGKPYRPEYDFYFELDENKYIIEMDGDFHNKVHSKSEYTIDDIKEIDKKKDILALKNGITMIRIDCSISEFDYIFNSIKNSILDKLFVLSKIDKVEINKKAYSSNIVDACKLYMTKTKDLNSISKILHIPYGTIYNYLKKGAEIGLCNYDPKFSLKYKGNLGFVGTYEVVI